MSPPAGPRWSLGYIKTALRQCRTERQCTRQYATAMTPATPTPAYQFPPPTPNFRPSQATKQNRFETGMRKIRVISPPRSTAKTCPDPISEVYASQLKTLDPTGVRTRLFSKQNAERVRPGDILHVRLKSGDPFSGVCLVVRQRHSPIDTSILLRNQLTRVGVEMWFKVYSPQIEGIEIVQRKEKRARRAKLYYMRQPKHDIGSVDNIVRQYMRQRMGGSISSKNTKGRDTNSHSKQNNKKK